LNKFRLLIRLLGEKRLITLFIYSTNAQYTNFKKFTFSYKKIKNRYLSRYHNE